MLNNATDEVDNELIKSINTHINSLRSSTGNSDIYDIELPSDGFKLSITQHTLNLPITGQYDSLTLAALKNIKLINGRFKTNESIVDHLYDEWKTMYMRVYEIVSMEKNIIGAIPTAEEQYLKESDSALQDIIDTLNSHYNESLEGTVPNNIATGTTTTANSDQYNWYRGRTSDDDNVFRHINYYQTEDKTGTKTKLINKYYKLQKKLLKLHIKLLNL